MCTNLLITRDTCLFAEASASVVMDSCGAHLVKDIDVNASFEKGLTAIESNLSPLFYFTMLQTPCPVIIKLCGNS